ncbi:hypothetical protein LTR66_016917, partial [Elasticomyces elasticus]
MTATVIGECSTSGNTIVPVTSIAPISSRNSSVTAHTITSYTTATPISTSPTGISTYTGAGGKMSPPGIFNLFVRLLALGVGDTPSAQGFIPNPGTLLSMGGSAVTSAVAPVATNVPIPSGPLADTTSATPQYSYTSVSTSAVAGTTSSSIVWTSG